MNSESSNPNNTNRTPTRSRTSQEIKFNKEYALSFNGILKAILILDQFAGSVSAASVPKLISREYYLIGEVEHIRNAFLFFSIVGLIFACILYIIFVLDLIDSYPSLQKFPWKIIVLSTDVVWMICMLLVSIFCACQEANYNEYPNYFLFYINEGAFGSASFFGFAATVLYGIDAYLVSKLNRDMNENNV